MLGRSLTNAEAKRSNWVRDVLDQLLAQIFKDHAAVMTQVIAHASRDADLTTPDQPLEPSGNATPSPKISPSLNITSPTLTPIRKRMCCPARRAPRPSSGTRDHDRHRPGRGSPAACARPRSSWTPISTQPASVRNEDLLFRSAAGRTGTLIGTAGAASTPGAWSQALRAQGWRNQGRRGRTDQDLARFLKA